MGLPEPKTQISLCFLCGWSKKPLYSEASPMPPAPQGLHLRLEAPGIRDEVSWWSLEGVWERFCRNMSLWSPVGHFLLSEFLLKAELAESLGLGM